MRVRERDQKESQIRKIASGEANQVRKYHVRSQPSGQMPNANRGNAASLTTVPSSSEEKFDGGIDRDD